MPRPDLQQHLAAGHQELVAQLERFGEIVGGHPRDVSRTAMGPGAGGVRGACRGVLLRTGSPEAAALVAHIDALLDRDDEVSPGSQR